MSKSKGRYELQARYADDDGRWYVYRYFSKLEIARGEQRRCESVNPITAERRIWDSEEGRIVE